MSGSSSSRGAGEGKGPSDEFSGPSVGEGEVPPPPALTDDMARLFAASMPQPSPPPSRWSLRSKLLGAILFAGIGVGASAMSCVGQSFSLRQARALEGIEQQLVKLQQSCPVAVPARETVR